jgi:hypothetical protein
MLLQMGSSCGDDSLYRQAPGPERLRGYGYSGVTGTNVRCIVNAPGVTKLPVPKIPETDTELLAGNHLHFASNLS